MVRDPRKNHKGKTNLWIKKRILNHHVGPSNSKQVSSSRVMSLILIWIMVLISLPQLITMQTKISNKIIVVVIIMRWTSSACKTTITKSKLTLQIPTTTM